MRRLFWIAAALLLINVFSALGGISPTVVETSAAEMNAVEVTYEAHPDVPVDLREPLQDALRSSSLVAESTDLFWVTAWRQSSDWAQITVADQVVIDAGWEGGFPDGLILDVLLHQSLGSSWEAEVIGDPINHRLYDTVPAGFMEKLGGFSESQNQVLKLPWTAGQDWRKTQGWHVPGDTLFGNGNAIDVAPVNTSNPSVNKAVLAVGVGVVSQRCADATQVNIRLATNDGDFYYVHLQPGTVRTDLYGKTVQRGQYLGQIRTAAGSFSNTCGSGNNPHLHLEVPNRNFTIDGANINTIATSANQSYWPSTNTRIDDGTTNPCGANELRVTANLTINPSGPNTAQNVTGTFSVRNTGSCNVNLLALVIGGRGPGNAIEDSPRNNNVTIAAGATYNYSTSRTFPIAGSYNFDVKAWVSGDWWLTVAGASGVTTARSVTVAAAPVCGPNMLRVSQSVSIGGATAVDANTPVTATYSVRNTGSCAVTLGVIGLGARGPAEENLDFPYQPNVTIQAGATWSYSGTRQFTLYGSHYLFATYQTTGGVWSGISAESTQTTSLAFTVRSQCGAQALRVSESVSVGASNTVDANTDVYATYDVQNTGTCAVTVNRIGLAARGPNDEHLDFPYPVGSVTIQAGQTFHFAENRQFALYGTHNLYATYETTGGIWYSIPAKPSKVSSLLVTVKSQCGLGALRRTSRFDIPLVVTEGSVVTATFTFKNTGTCFVTIPKLGVRVIDSNSDPVESPFVSNITLGVGESYEFTGSVTFPSTPGYVAMAVYQDANGTWNSPEGPEMSWWVIQVDPAPPTATDTPTYTVSPTETATSTHTPTPSNTPSPTSSGTVTATSTESLTPSSTATFTPQAPTSTFTPDSPTSTWTPQVPTATFTPAPPTSTWTTVVITATFTPQVPTATFTPAPPTSTWTPVVITSTFTPAPPTSTWTPVVITATFTPAPPTSTFTPVVITATFTPQVPTATFTPAPPTSTWTPVVVTATFTPQAPTSTFTPVVVTSTSTQAVPTSTFTQQPPTATNTPKPTATPKPATPKVTLDKDKSKFNGWVTASFTGFNPGGIITLRWSDGTVLGQTSATSTGSGSLRFRTPLVALGDYLVEASNNFGQAASSNLRVIPRIMLAPADSGPVGTRFRVYFYGFAAGEAVDIRFYGADGVSYQILKQVTIASNGRASTLVYVPAGATIGGHKISGNVVGVPRSASTTFTVTRAAANSAEDPTTVPSPSVTETLVATITPIPTATATEIAIPTDTPVVEPTVTETPRPTDTATPEPTATEPPIEQPTATEVPPTDPSTPEAPASGSNLLPIWRHAA